MNYLKEIVAFGDYLLYNRVPTGEIALWYALMAVNNRSGWNESFAAGNFVLMQLTGLSKSGLDSARNGLKQRGLIDYAPGRGNRPGGYRMIPFAGGISDAPPDAAADGERTQRKAEAGRTGGRAYHKELYKQKPKPKREEGSPSPPAEAPEEAERGRYGAYQNVLLTDGELDKLKAGFPSDWEARVERLSEYMAASGRTYRSHLAVIFGWARRDAEKSAEKPAEKPGRGFAPSYDLSELEARGLHLPEFGAP